MSIEFTYFQPYYGSENSFIYILVLVLFLLAIFSFIKSKYDVLNPSFIYSICLTGCCALAALYTKTWNLPMHFNTAVIIISMSILFLLGGCLAEYCCSINKSINDYNSINSKGFLISWPVWFFLITVLLYFIYLNYLEFMTVAKYVTSETKFTNMLTPFVRGLAHHDIELTRWNTYRFRFANGVAYISVLGAWLNLMANQRKEALKWSCLVLLFIPFVVLTGGRQQFMYLIIFAMISFFLVYRKNHKMEGNLCREISIIVLAVAAFLFCFLGVGVLNGKIEANTGFLNVIVHYAGINISAFDVYINEMVKPDTPYIGETTLIPVYGFLHAHGFNDLPVFSMYNYEFTAFGPVTTNVYTAFYRYINDFGYIGCAVIMFLLGFLYSFLYKKIYYYGLKNWMILVYASISYPIFLIGREERFFNEILSTGEVSFLIETLILYKLIELFNEWKEKCNEAKNNN